MIVAIAFIAHIVVCSFEVNGWGHDEITTDLLRDARDLGQLLLGESQRRRKQRQVRSAHFPANLRNHA